jgi:glycerophosphoryl diester phosphodiesterase
VVIEHDSDFMRVAGVNLEVWKATNADLAVGSSFDPAFLDQRVPTLREVPELAKGRAGVFIELKYYGHDQNLLCLRL